MGRCRRADDVVMLMPGWADALAIRERITPSAWIEKNMVLSRSYATQGRVVLLPWQKQIPDFFVDYDDLVFVAPVQTGKSMMEEGILGYIIDQDPQNVMVAYEKKETVEDVFDERLRPLIVENPSLRRYWDGDIDNITKRRIKLQHMVIRVASGTNRSDIASHNSGVVIADEFAKWKPRGGSFDPYKLLGGRTHASRMLGRRVKKLFVSSPRTEDDPMYRLSHGQGVRFVRPHYQCPTCGGWQVLVDSQIKEVPNKNGDFDHNPDRIRQDGAAWYECEHCKGEITEAQRVEMSQVVVYAAVDQKTGKTIETIDKNGNLGAKVSASRCVVNWNRLVDVTWRFSDCLASYFEALSSSDGSTLADYQNEDMARWVKTHSVRFSDSWLQKKAKSSKYCQFGSGAYVPDGVKVLLCGIDTQDDGFYVVIRGFGQNLESWLVRAEFVKCDSDQGPYVNPAEVHSLLSGEINRYKYVKRDGTELSVFYGFIDRGGHRRDDVDYICAHSTYLQPYIGSTRKDAPLITVSKGGFHMGNTRLLSRTVEKWMQSEVWHLPKDIQPEYCRQVLEQHDEEVTDARGNTKKRWVTGDDTGRPDHYRDCENLIVAAVHSVGLHDMMFTEEGAVAVEKQSTNRPSGEKSRRQQTHATIGGVSVNDFMGGFN